ncbi:hypothetical protein [Victivallis vadensis]|uniref:hypothetical protein n=1 Tax=Victivallis vadensis TaxID=172901 RepID=UPI0023F6967B|nr:hypothetical protein [Victivallis vadensis]
MNNNNGRMWYIFVSDKDIPTASIRKNDLLFCSAVSPTEQLRPEDVVIWKKQSSALQLGVRKQYASEMPIGRVRAIHRKLN